MCCVHLDGPVLRCTMQGVVDPLVKALGRYTVTGLNSLKPARPLSPFYLLFGNEPLQHGLRAAGALSVLAVSLALLVIGGIVFARRDLA